VPGSSDEVQEAFDLELLLVLFLQAWQNFATGHTMRNSADRAAAMSSLRNSVPGSSDVTQESTCRVGPAAQHRTLPAHFFANYPCRSRAIIVPLSLFFFTLSGALAEEVR